MKNLNFYVNEPSLLKRAFFLGYGNTVVLVPALASAVLSDSPWSYLVTYGGLGSLLLFDATKGKLLKLDESFRDSWKNHRLSVKLSRRLKETMKNAGLVYKDKEESTGADGKRKIKEIVTYPYCEMKADDYNYYLKLSLLPGQTSSQWENKVDAFAQALKCDLVGCKIDKGVISLTLQHSLMNVTEVIQKHDNSHELYIGYRPGGLLGWRFDLNPNLLVVGVVGAGKSTFVRTLLSQIPKDWTLKIVDGKQVEFNYMSDFGYDVADNKDGFLRYIDEAIEEMDRRYKLLSENRKTHYTELEGLKPYFLVCDEWISLVESLAKKTPPGEKGASERDQFFEKIKTLSTKGRAAGVQLVAILQRPDAEFLSGIVRDMFTAKVLLKGSKVAAKMMYDDDGKDLSPLSTGQGYCMIDTISNFSFPNYDLDEFVQHLEAKHRVIEVEQNEHSDAPETAPEPV